MKFLIFFILIGSIYSLQHNVEYHYHYEGQIASGIPTLRPQVASFGIKAKLILQMRENKHGVARLTDIEVGEFNEDLQCVRLRQPVPFSYQSIPDPYKKTLEEPFNVNFLEESGHVMDVPKSDVEFITNIRKSIVEMLRLEPILANLGGIKGDQLSKHISGGEAPEGFTVEEESIMGRCESEYSITKLGHHDLKEQKEIIDKHLKMDVQSKSSPRSPNSKVPKLEDQYYRLVRAINFDKCHDIVILQHAGGANMAQEGSSLFRAVQSRSSVSVYILKGHPGSFRVERAIVEGDVIVNPFGFKTHRLQATTNQTLAIESVQPIKNPIILPINLRQVKSWRFEVASPYSPPQGQQKEWVNYHDKNEKYYPVSILSSVGIPPTTQEIQEYQKTLQELLDKAVEELYSEPSVSSSEMTKSSLATTRLNVMTRIMKLLPIEKIRETFTKTFEGKDVQSHRKQMFLIDIAAASGASAPMKVLLEKMEKQEISHHRIASIFFTLPNNLFSPTVIPELMEYVKRLDIEKNPLLSSSALINFASLAERICINHNKFNYSIPHALFGQEDCKPAQILNGFLPFLEEKAKSASKSHEKAIYLQAIINLGSPEIIPILKPFIYGKQDKNPQVRALAIYGLSHLRLPDSARERVFDTLMTVVDNIEERSDIRQASFTTLVTWHPSAAWWQRMARSTWRENSRNFATFVTLTAESLAKSTEPSLRHQSRIAAFVLPLLKPFSPSLHSSYNRIYSRFDPVSKIGMKFDYSTIQSSDDTAPFEIYTSLRKNFGDLFIHLFEVSISNDKVGKSMTDLLNLMKRVTDVGRHKNMNGKHPSEKTLIESLSRTQGLRRDSDEPQMNIFLRIFQNLYQYIPLNAEVISKIAGNDAERVLKELLEGVHINPTKYLNPFQLEFLIPTEIGLPLNGQISMPTVNLGDADVKLVAPGLQNPTLRDLLKNDHLSLQFKTNYKYSSKLYVRIGTLSPWSKRVAEAGIANYDEMNLPFYGDLSWTRSHEIKNVSLNISPHTHQKFQVFHQHNIPFTMMRKYVPDKDLTADYKVIGVGKDRKPTLKVRKQLDKSYTGISSEVSYSGDAPYPFTSAFLLDYLRKPELQGKLLTSPVAEQWQYSLSWDPRNSESRNVTLALSYVRARRFLSHSEEEIPDFSVNDGPQERLRKFQGISKSNEVHGLNAQLFFNSPNFRRYEVILSCTKDLKPVHPAKYIRRVVAAALVSKIPGHLDSPKALCSETHMETPYIYDLQTLKKVVQSHPQKQLSSQIYYGSSCKSSSIAKAQGTLKLSEERQRLVSDELEKVCDFDPKDPTVQLQTAAVYDVGTMDIEFSREKIPRSLLNASYHLQEFFEGALFPHGLYDNMYSGQPNKIRIEARRPISSKKYSISVATPQKHSIFSEIHVPFVATKIVPLTGLQTTYDKVTDSLLISSDIHPCTILKGSVMTFDWVSYYYTPDAGLSQCWTTALKDIYQQPLFIARVRQNSEGLQEAQVKTPDGEIHVESTYKQLWINGIEMSPKVHYKTVKDSSGKTILTVTRKKDGFFINWINYFSLFISKLQIQINPMQPIYNNVRGLCGDYDGMQKYDKTGPKECLYTDDKLFEYSWTDPEGDGCDQEQLKQWQEQVQNYQKNCTLRPPTFRPSQTRSKLDFTTIYKKPLFDCSTKIYPVKNEGASLCATYQSVIKCKDICKPYGITYVTVKAGCWPKDNVPDDVASGESRGFLLSPPNEKAPQYTDMNFREPQACHLT